MKTTKISLIINVILNVEQSYYNIYTNINSYNYFLKSAICRRVLNKWHQPGYIVLPNNEFAIIK
ncbi:hypothetical protein DBR32_14730 [Taibaiella sp. KBW10]|nr:hypothetical protein DBR32_14730 [Taibaiella sp. KBW10]